MDKPAVAVVGTFDSKGEEHRFLRGEILARGLDAVTINVGTKGPPGFEPDHDLRPEPGLDRDLAIRTAVASAQKLVAELHAKGEISGIISAGGGTGTHIGASIMKVLPLGVPKVMVSTVASRDMSEVVGTRDMTMIHTVSDLLGVNSISGLILAKAAGAVCGMVQASFTPAEEKKTVGLSMFGFITDAAEMVRAELEARGREVVAFHANGTGGLALEELTGEGRFDAVLDLAVHELADSLYPGGYCRLIGPGRLDLDPENKTPRLVVPGGLDCVVLEFTRESVPPEHEGKSIFFYDFRSAVRLTREETVGLARDLAAKLNRAPDLVKVLIPMKGWSEADREGGPLFDPELAKVFVATLKERLDERVETAEADLHINDPEFARLAAAMMDEMISGG